VLAVGVVLLVLGLANIAVSLARGRYEIPFLERVTGRLEDTDSRDSSWSRGTHRLDRAMVQLTKHAVAWMRVGGLVFVVLGAVLIVITLV
jgi:hypothetical protein